MLEIRSKEEIIEIYKKRYPDSEKYLIDELSKNYDIYLNLIKSKESKEEALEVFEEEIRENERSYKDNQQVKDLEGASYDRYFDVLSEYGKITFFRDAMLV